LSVTNVTRLDFIFLMASVPPTISEPYDPPRERKSAPGTGMIACYAFALAPPLPEVPPQ
jgi:hypothetical protein